MAAVSLNAIVGGSVVVKKSIVINTSQNWTAPLNLAGNTVWITGCGGGGSGAENVNISGNDAYGGFGGCFVEKVPVIVTAGATYAVTIGAGGAGVTTGDGQSGGDTTFDSLLTIKGGSGGDDLSTSDVSVMQRLSQKRGVRPAIIGFGSSPYLPIQIAESINGNVCGNAVTALGPGTGKASGGAAGYFGNGANSAASSSSTNAPAAPANSGAGGGCVYGASISTSGAGGSGRLIIEWEEFL